jgi:hypothetical protein
LFSLVNSRSFVISILHQCIDDELIKPESEMDTEVIDLCASALCKLYGIEFKEIPMYKPWEEEKES